MGVGNQRRELGIIGEIKESAGEGGATYFVGDLDGRLAQGTSELKVLHPALWEERRPPPSWEEARIRLWGGWGELGS